MDELDTYRHYLNDPRLNQARRWSRGSGLLPSRRIRRLIEGLPNPAETCQRLKNPARTGFCRHSPVAPIPPMESVSTVRNRTLCAGLVRVSLEQARLHRKCKQRRGSHATAVAQANPHGMTSLGLSSTTGCAGRPGLDDSSKSAGQARRALVPREPRAAGAVASVTYVSRRVLIVAADAARARGCAAARTGSCHCSTPGLPSMTYRSGVGRRIALRLPRRVRRHLLETGCGRLRRAHGRGRFDRSSISRCRRSSAAAAAEATSARGRCRCAGPRAAGLRDAVGSSKRAISPSREPLLTLGITGCTCIEVCSASAIAPRRQGSRRSAPVWVAAPARRCALGAMGQFRRRGPQAQLACSAYPRARGGDSASSSTAAPTGEALEAVSRVSLPRT